MRGFLKLKVVIRAFGSADEAMRTNDQAALFAFNQQKQIGVPGARRLKQGLARKGSLGVRRLPGAKFPVRRLLPTIGRLEENDRHSNKPSGRSKSRLRTRRATFVNKL
jgi:hypothetical protein